MVATKLRARYALAVQGAVDDGPFVHACYCGRWGFFGYEVALLKDRTGLVLRRASSGRRGSEFTEGTTMKLATAIVLAVLWAGAAAAESFAGAYRDVGPPVETYDGRVPAWITTARVSQVGTKRYSIRMSTGRSEPAGCTGEVTATGTLIGTAIMAAASDGSDCKLAITFERSTILVREQGNCFTFRGMQCHFGGNLKRERSGGGAVSPSRHNGP